MRVAVSNIGWPLEIEGEVLTILERAGVRAIEIAPTRLWPDWNGVSVSGSAAWGRQYAERGLSVPALQAILFGKPEYKLFGTEAQREDLLDHLRMCADLANAMGAQNLVFGAPKNRELNGLSQEMAFGMAREFFGAVGAYYESTGVFLCLEANPVQYGCQFMTTSADAGKLVRAVNSPGFCLHLDTACMYLAQEDIPAAIRRNFDLLRHFHVSEPFLGTFDAPVIDHAGIAESLRLLGYQGWISLEMREPQHHPGDLTQAIEFLSRNYGTRN